MNEILTNNNNPKIYCQYNYMGNLTRYIYEIILLLQIIIITNLLQVNVNGQDITRCVHEILTAKITLIYRQCNYKWLLNMSTT